MRPTREAPVSHGSRSTPVSDTSPQRERPSTVVRASPAVRRAFSRRSAATTTSPSRNMGQSGCWQRCKHEHTDSTWFSVVGRRAPCGLALVRAALLLLAVSRQLSRGRYSALPLALTVRRPSPRTSTRISTTVSTVRGAHVLSRAQSHERSCAPFASANLTAWSYGSPMNVAGAAARAAASAAVDAWYRAAST